MENEKVREEEIDSSSSNEPCETVKNQLKKRKFKWTSLQSLHHNFVFSIPKGIKTNLFLKKIR